MTGASAAGEQTANPLRLLLVHERFAPDFGGGGEYIVLETARHLQARGHAVRVLTTGDPALTEFEGIRTRRLPISRYRLNMAWRAVRAEAADVDLIQAYNYHAAYPAVRAGMALGKPVVCGVLGLFGGVWRSMRGPIGGRLFERIERFQLQQPFAARVFFSDASLELAHRFGPGGPNDVVIAPGITSGEHAPGSKKDCVVFSGKLESRKGLETVLDVARRLADVPFRIIGWGERYEEIARALPPNVHLEHFKDRAQLADTLGRARIFLFPTRAETFGLIVAEAMAAGCAVVSSAPLPFEGARIQPDDVAGAARAVRALWDDPAQCAQCGEHNEILASRYTWPRHVDTLERLYAKVLRAREATG